MIKPNDTEMARLIAALWERNQAQVEKRLHVLEAAAAASRRGSLEEELRKEAREIAHKLAGSLGMFGFATGSEIARRLEMLFERGDPDPEILSELTVQLRGSLKEPVKL